MAILDVQGFGTGATAVQLGYLGSGNSTGLTGGRFTAGVLACSGNNLNMIRDWPSRSKFGIHFALLQNANVAHQFQEAGVATHMVLSLDGSAKFQVAVAGGTFNSGVQYTFGQWVGIELYIEVADSPNGVLKMWVNGSSTPVINQTGIDTRTGGTGVINRYLYQLASGSTPCFWSDWVVYDDQSPATTAPIGDVRVDTLFPSGNGNSSQLVGSDGNSTDNYLLVDETPFNSDTDYVESATTSDKDTYAMGNLASTAGTVLAVQGRLVAKKTDAGTREVKPVYRLSGTEVDGTTFPLPSAYAILQKDIQETKPGGGAWSISDVNSAEYGVKVTA